MWSLVETNLGTGIRATTQKYGQFSFSLNAISLSLSANNTMRSRLNSQLIISLALKLSKEQKNQIQSYDRGFEVALEFTTITHPGKIRDSSPLWSVLPFGFFPCHKWSLSQGH